MFEYAVFERLKKNKKTSLFVSRTIGTVVDGLDDWSRLQIIDSV